MNLKNKSKADWSIKELMVIQYFKFSFTSHNMSVLIMFVGSQMFCIYYVVSCVWDKIAKLLWVRLKRKPQAVCSCYLKTLFNCSSRWYFQWVVALFFPCSFVDLKIWKLWWRQHVLRICLSFLFFRNCYVLSFVKW